MRDLLFPGKTDLEMVNMHMQVRPPAQNKMANFFEFSLISGSPCK